MELGLDSFDLFYTSAPKLEEFHPGFCWWHSLDTALHKNNVELLQIKNSATQTDPSTDSL